jgi:hypothetical protein
LDCLACDPVAGVETPLEANLYRARRAADPLDHLPGAVDVRRDGFSQNTGSPASVPATMSSG